MTSSRSTRSTSALILLRGGIERLLFRRVEGPAVYLGTEFGGRRSAQTAIWRIGEALVRLLAPIMSFTAKNLAVFAALEDRPQRASGELPQRSRHPGHRQSRRTIRSTREDWNTLLAVRDRGPEGTGRGAKQQAIGGATRRRRSPSRLPTRFTRFCALPGSAALSVHRVGSQLEQASGNGSGGVIVTVRKAEGENASAAGISRPAWERMPPIQPSVSAAAPC